MEEGRSTLFYCINSTVKNRRALCFYAANLITDPTVPARRYHIYLWVGGETEYGVAANPAQRECDKDDLGERKLNKIKQLNEDGHPV